MGAADDAASGLVLIPIVGAGVFVLVMVWIPFVTFWQISADLPMGLGVPAGHGHNYTGDHVDGWAAVLQTDGWSSADAAELREIVMAEPDQ